jgi:hypothetical protein
VFDKAGFVLLFGDFYNAMHGILEAIDSYVYEQSHSIQYHFIERV